MIAADIKQTANDAQLMAAGIDGQNPASALPDLPLIPSHEDLNAKPLIDAQETILTTIIIPGGGSFTSVSSTEDILQISPDDLIRQSIMTDDYGALILNQHAFRPIDDTGLLTRSSYALTVRLYDQSGDVLNIGDGRLQLDLSANTLIYSSLHELAQGQRHGLDAFGAYVNGPTAGSLSAQLLLNMQISGSQPENTEASLSALTAGQQIIGSLITTTDNPHFVVV